MARDVALTALVGLADKGSCVVLYKSAPQHQLTYRYRPCIM